MGSMYGVNPEMAWARQYSLLFAMQFLTQYQRRKSGWGLVEVFVDYCSDHAMRIKTMQCPVLPRPVKGVHSLEVGCLDKQRSAKWCFENFALDFL